MAYPSTTFIAVVAMLLERKASRYRGFPPNSSMKA